MFHYFASNNAKDSIRPISLMQTWKWLPIVNHRFTKPVTLSIKLIKEASNFMFTYSVKRKRVEFRFPMSGVGAGSRSFARFMVTRVYKIYHRRGQSRIVLATKTNIVLPRNKSAFKLNTMARIFTVGCMSTNSKKVWKSLVIKPSLLTGKKNKRPSYRRRGHFE